MALATWEHEVDVYTSFGSLPSTGSTSLTYVVETDLGGGTIQRQYYNWDNGDSEYKQDVSIGPKPHPPA